MLGRKSTKGSANHSVNRLPAVEFHNITYELDSDNVPVNDFENLYNGDITTPNCQKNHENVQTVDKIPEKNRALTSLHRVQTRLSASAQSFPARLEPTKTRISRWKNTSDNIKKILQTVVVVLTIIIAVLAIINFGFLHDPLNLSKWFESPTTTSGKPINNSTKGKM